MNVSNNPADGPDTSSNPEAPRPPLHADASQEAADVADELNAMPEEALAPARPPFLVAGIGTSAGGLTALEAFFTAIPTDSAPNIAFVVVQHLTPDRKSILAELVARFTHLPVVEVEDGLAIQPNVIYIIPPNRDMTLTDGFLHLQQQDTFHGQRLPINFFFRSLAAAQGERAIGIVLSGTGSDGTEGIRAISSEGGLVMAQAPESAEYDGMPRSALATGLVDFVLPPAEMPGTLTRIAGPIHALRTPADAPLTPTTEESLRQIVALLHSHNGRDFSHYKHNTVVRRVRRRMAVQQIQTLGEYVRYLAQTPAEADELFRDLLIGVTSFFRDPDAFQALEERAIPRLLADKANGDTIRIWVPGCSSGEEAYSIAILLQEQMALLQRVVAVQIFATDIDPRAIQQVRAGVYPAAIAADLSPERLNRFFVRSQDGASYRIQKTLRDMLIVSEQDMIQDPPFSRLDLISCRNLLIYLDATLQRKILALFHYALNPGGILFLGTSETVGESASLFAPLDRRWKLFIRQEGRTVGFRAALGQTTMPSRPSLRMAGLASENESANGPLYLRKLTEQALLRDYAPVGILVNPRGDILFIHGRSGRFLEPAPGEATLNILAMARHGLRQTLTTSLHKAVSTRTAVDVAGLRVTTESGLCAVDLTVRPLPNVQEGDSALLFLVILKEVPQSALTRDTPSHDTPSHDADLPDLSDVQTASQAELRVRELEQQLQLKEDYLQTTHEEMETAFEELKSTNEELQSVNEEVQSTNEELETSKEELQSINEELATVNAELQQKVTDLSQANNDMNNLLAGTGVGTIFVDDDLRLQRFTPAATALINLIPGDIGRPVSHIVSNLVTYDRLTDDMQAVLTTLTPREIDVQTKSGAWYLMSIRPYRTLQNAIEGLVITFVDITRVKQAEAVQHLAIVVNDAYDAITVQDLEGQILAWNPAAEQLYGWRADEAMALPIAARVPPARQADELQMLLRLGQAEVLQPYRTERITKDGRTLAIWLTATALVNTAGQVYAVATTERRINT